MDHLKKIYELCLNTPKTMHWLPTQERKYLPLPGSTYPENLLIRLSNSKNNTKPGNAWTHWSTVVDSGGDCPASKQGNIGAKHSRMDDELSEQVEAWLKIGESASKRAV